MTSPHEDRCWCEEFQAQLSASKAEQEKARNIIIEAMHPDLLQGWIMFTDKDKWGPVYTKAQAFLEDNNTPAKGSE